MQALQTAENHHHADFKLFILNQVEDARLPNER